MMPDLITESLTRLAELIRTRRVSPVEVAEACLQQIDKLNPTLNAVVTLAPDVMDRARAAESALTSGKILGALHGVPVTIKDTIETSGLRSTSGSRTRAGFMPDCDAPAVARLKAAGAIILGKTNVAEMAMDYTGDNPVFGRTNNPHDPSRTPGGSSGGEAAAIAQADFKEAILLLDEEKGFKRATTMQITVVRTLRLLNMLKDAEAIREVRPYHEKLDKLGFFMTLEDRNQLLNEAGEL